MFAQRLAQVSASATLKVAAEAERLRRAGHNVVDFSAGEPDFPTPEHVKAAGKEAIDANFTRYTASQGVLELRQAICDRYKKDYGIETTPAEVIVTNGGKQALFNAALALFDPGDEVITHSPYWPTIPEQVKLVGAVPVIVPTSPDDGFTVHAEAIITRDYQLATLEATARGQAHDLHAGIFNDASGDPSVIDTKSGSDFAYSLGATWQALSSVQAPRPSPCRKADNFGNRRPSYGRSAQRQRRHGDRFRRADLRVWLARGPDHRRRRAARRCSCPGGPAAA